MRFSPHIKGAAVRAVSMTGRYAGNRGGVEFAIYRTQEGITLLTREGKRWRAVPAVTVVDALAEIEVLSSAMPAEAEG